MWGVFSDYLEMKSSDIVAMTCANFSNATDPSNPASVYHGASSFTRCVWEVHLGHAVRFILCATRFYIFLWGRDPAEDRAGSVRRRLLGN